jgi:hypothetical protein
MTPRDVRLCSIALATVIVAVVATGAPLAQPANLPATIVTLSGRAEVWRAPTRTWSVVRLRDEVFAGDGVRTIAGRLAMRTGSDQALRLGARTPLLFVEPEPGAGAGPTTVRMDGGLLWVAVLPASPPPSQITVRAGPATATVRAGGASIAMNVDGSTTVAVYHGLTTVAAAGWQRDLTQDQQVVITPGGPPKEILPLKREKRDAEWARWNEQQDSAGGFGARIEKR